MNPNRHKDDWYDKWRGQAPKFINQITEISSFDTNKDQDLEDYGYGGI